MFFVVDLTKWSAAFSMESFADIVNIFNGLSLQERWKNGDFPARFFPGVATGIWWTMVTLTTVGYAIADFILYYLVRYSVG